MFICRFVSIVESFHARHCSPELMFPFPKRMPFTSGGRDRTSLSDGFDDTGVLTGVTSLRMVT